MRCAFDRNMSVQHKQDYDTGMTRLQRLREEIQQMHRSLQEKQQGLLNESKPDES